MRIACIVLTKEDLPDARRRKVLENFRGGITQNMATQAEIIVYQQFDPPRYTYLKNRYGSNDTRPGVFSLRR